MPPIFQKVQSHLGIENKVGAFFSRGKFTSLVTVRCNLICYRARILSIVPLSKEVKAVRQLWSTSIYCAGKDNRDL